MIPSFTDLLAAAYVLSWILIIVGILFLTIELVVIGSIGAAISLVLAVLVAIVDHVN
jgi:hypothetical protein